MLKPSQCRAARALLEISREKLANEAGVGVRTIADFESGKRRPIAATAAAISKALTSLGVELIPENGGGPGVRLANHE